MTYEAAAPVAGAADEEVAGPVVRRDRIGVIDVLRGFALLGILMLNIDDFVGPEVSGIHDVPMGLAKAAFVGWHAGLDYLILALKWTFFEGKMRGLFAVLFGASTLLLLGRITDRAGAERAADIFHRRNMWLLLFGILHGCLIWHGDILACYASVALLFLYPLRHVAAKKLLVAGMAIWLVGGTLGGVNITSAFDAITQDADAHAGLLAQGQGRTPSAEQAKAIEALAKARKDEPKQIAEAIEEGRAGYVAAIAGNTAGFLIGNGILIRTLLCLEVIGAAIAGMGLFKLGFITGRLPRRTYVRTALIGYAISLPLGIGGVWYAAQTGFSRAGMIEWLFLPYFVLEIAAVLANASLVILIVQAGWFKGATRSLAAVGRMAITNYLMTSVLCRFVFSWSPWKLYGTLEYYQYLYVVAAVWVINLVFSGVWLRYFAFGPMEWVWRSLTYWRLQPMRSIGTSTASA